MTTTILTGHVLDVLATLPERHYHGLVTSPPFYGLRAYGTEPQVWGGDGSCGDGEHDWGDSSVVRKGSTNGRGDLGSTLVSVNAPKTTAPGLANDHGATLQYRHDRSRLCRRCGAWRGELGAEPAPDCLGWARGEPPDACLVGCFLCHLRLVMQAVRRVLRDDGVAFVELGDGYASSPVGRFNGGSGLLAGRDLTGHATSGRADKSKLGIPAKSLILVPERFRLACQADGWVVRSVIRWAKKAPMPESVRDRPTSAVSEVVMLTKTGAYFADMEAVKEQAIHEGRVVKASGDGAKNTGTGNPTAVGFTKHDTTVSGRNPRNYTLLSPEPSKRAHYASYGPKAITPLVKMATSEAGCCAVCGAAWERVTERDKHPTRDMEAQRTLSAARTGRVDGHIPGPEGMVDRVTTTGWRSRCACQPEEPPHPCRILDCFAGSGTTLVVAERLGLDATGIELNEQYARMARERLAVEGAPLFAGDEPDGAPDRNDGLMQLTLLA